jgi:hypothetical protein
MSGDEGSATPPVEDGAFCPSAQPDLDQGVVFGVVGGSASEPRVAYLTDPVPVTRTLLQLAAPAHPTEVFRMGAPCARGGCQHYTGSRCGLVRQLVEGVEPVADEIPPCRLRPRCRWWREEGAAACRRCPMIVTELPNPTPQLTRAARPAPPPARPDG